MSRIPRPIYLSLAGITLVGIIVGMYLFALKRSAKHEPEDAVTKHTVATPAEDVLKYWTAERMRNAKPAPMPKVNKSKRRKRQVQRPSEA